MHRLTRLAPLRRLTRPSRLARLSRSVRLARLARLAAVSAFGAALAGALIVGLPGAAHADGIGSIRCNLNPASPECTVSVVQTVGGGTTSGASGVPACHFHGRTVDCHNGFGWFGAGGCYYGKDYAGFLAAQEWIKRCIDPATGDIHDAGVVLLLEPPSALAAMMRSAVSQLRIPQPVIAASPALTAPHVVQVPVWWWIAPDVWRPRTATASLPGISVTATATPDNVTWDAGDGTTTRCEGPGLAWTAKYAPTAASPSCGHTYTTTSREAPGGTFTVRATITWRIAWAGGGLSGTEPVATTTASARVQVTELRAVITG